MSLISSCHIGDYDEIERHLRNGADPNRLSSRSRLSPIIVTCLHSKADLAILRLLLAYGADPNVCGMYESNPLSILAVNNNFDALKLLYINGGRMPNKREDHFLRLWFELHKREDVINFFTAPHKYISLKDISLNFTRLHSIRSTN